MQMTTIGTLPVSVFPDPEALGDALAQTILEGIRDAARDGRRYLLGCPGGRSPRTTYQALGRLAAATGQPLSHVVIVMMDEYLFHTAEGFINCPPDAHYSCHRFAEEEIRKVINRDLAPEHRIPADQVWFPQPAHPARYDDDIRAAGGIDLFIIASGASDGHVAFNPPGAPADSTSRIITLPDSTRSDNMVTFPEFTDLREVPTFGVSVGLGTIARLSRQAVLIAHSADKQYAVRRLASCTDFDPQWPASIIYRCSNARAMLDETAAEGLR